MDTSSIAVKPSKPTVPLAYTGLQVRPFPALPTSITAAYQAVISGEYGGWGSLTMGLLKPTGLAAKSYGILGQQASTSAYQAQAQGYLAELGQMTSALQTPHFLVVSLWANDWTGANQGAKKFEIEFQASPWSTSTATSL